MIVGASASHRVTGSGRESARLRVIASPGREGSRRVCQYRNNCGALAPSPLAGEGWGEGELREFMATIVRFEDIQAWQEARILTREIYRLTSLVSYNRNPRQLV